MNKENNIIKNFENDLILSIYKLIERESLLADFFISQKDYKMAENLYLDLIILAEDLWQILGGTYDYERLAKYQNQITRFYEEENINLDMENLDPAKRKSHLGIISDNIRWANNGQWIDLTNDLYTIRKNYEIQAAIKLSDKSFLGAKKIYQRVIGINEDLIKYIDDPDDKIEKSKNLRDLGHINEELGNKAEAEENFSEGTKILENTFDEDIEISINYNLAKAYYDQAEFFKAKNNFDQAIVSAKKGVEICRKRRGKSYKISLNPVLIDLYNNIAEGYFLAGDLDKSSKFADLGLEMAKKFDQKLGSKFSKEKLDRALLNRVRILNEKELK